MSNQVFDPRNRNHQHRGRSARGQAIAEGAAMMPVIIGISLFMIILLFFIGTTFYYWIQLTSVATQLASYLSTQVKVDQTALTAEQKTDLDAKANKLFSLLNFPSLAVSGGGGPSMNLSTNLTNAPALSVTLTLTGIKTFGGVIPSYPIVATGVALSALFESKFEHYAAVSFTDVGEMNGRHNGVTLFVPCYEVAAFGDWGVTKGSIPAGMSQLGHGGSNAIYDSNPRNCFGGSY